jgi:hypothetical protein
LFDGIQNAVIKGKSSLDVYLKNDELKECFPLGTTDYAIFPNCALPISFPFFSYRKLGSYLFIPYQMDDIKFTINYDALLIKCEMKHNINEKKSFPYATHYSLRQGEMYNFEKDLVHKPFETSIDY